MNHSLARHDVLARIGSLTRGRLTPIFYAASSVVTSSAQLIAGFLVIRWITPEELGLWQSVRLAQVYAFILLAGVNNGLSRELPFFLGKGKQEFANRLAASAFFCVTIVNVLVILAGFGCVIALAHRGAHLVWAIVAVTLLIVIAFYQQILTCTFRANDSFQRLTRIQLAEAALSIATIPLVYYLGYAGMLARTVFIASAVLCMMYSVRPMRVRMRADWQTLKLLLKTGLPIFGLDYAKNSCGTLDKVVLLKLGGFRDVGVYALAGVAVQTLGALSSSLSSYVYPRMTYKFGERGDPRLLWRFGLKFVLLAVGFTAVAAVCAWFVLPYLVPAFLPKYLGGLRAAQIVLLGGILEGATLIANALWSMKVWRLMVLYQLVSAGLLGLGPLLGVIFISTSLDGVASGVVAGTLGRALLALALTYYGTHKAAPKPSPL